MKTLMDVLEFYDERYDPLGSWTAAPGVKIMLGDTENRTCRFCRRTKPEVTFRKVAHAIPEALGNKGVESAYECDACNEEFGCGIENDLGNWSKPVRTFARIRGKRGVPSLKKGGTTPGWRIDYEDTGFNIISYEEDPLFEDDTVKREITFKLKRDPYTPVAVLKAFVKIGLTLMPEIEINAFYHLLAWIKQRDHSIPVAETMKIVQLFVPGAMPPDLTTAVLLRRKPTVDDCPYAFLSLTFGNQSFQVPLPSKQHDEHLNGRQMTIYPFPPAWAFAPGKYSKTRAGLLDLTGRELVRGESVPIVCGYDDVIRGKIEDGQTGVVSSVAEPR